MTDIRRVSLFSKLNPMLYKALETATAFAKLRGNAYVELVHWLHQILQLQDSDMRRIIKRAGLNLDAVEQDLVRALDRLPHGATSISDISEHVDNAVERAWVYASLRFEATSIRGAYLLAGIIKTPGLRQVLSGISREFDKLVPDVLVAQLAAWTEGSPEDDFDAAPSVGTGRRRAGGAQHQGDGAPAGGSALAKYASDLTAKARAGELDPVYGRDDEIRQIIDILMRRRQNNPLLTGEAGVGKTAVVEGLASRLASGDVPPSLKDVSLWVLDPTLLQAGAGVKGEFEQRLRQVIDEVEKSPKPIVLFVDEVHTLVGAGGTAGTGDAANLLKPALARGRLRTIGATTWSEYKKYIEKDPALTRRFQTIQVHEPTEPKAVIMLRGISAELEKHHGVLILDAALEAAVSLSHRYIPARQLPDKAVSLLDTACARVALSQHALPAALEDLQRRIEVLGIESGIAGREAAIGVGEHQRVEDIAAQVATAQAELDLLEQRRVEEARWSNASWRCASCCRPRPCRCRPKRKKRQRARRLKHRKTSSPPNPRRTPEEIRAELDEAQDKLVQLQGESPLILAAVDAQAIATVVADWTGIPIGRMVRDDAQSVLRLGEILSARVVAQPDALETISRRIRTARARLDNPNKPVGVFLLCGPSGVGKTETALALSEALVRRRAEPRDHQHERVPGVAHRLHAEGRAARLRGLWRRRRAHRGRAPPALQRGAARRDREGAHRRARDLLPGVRQGLDGRRRGPPHRLSQHRDHHDLQRRHRPGHAAVRRPDPAPRPRAAGRRAARAAAQGVRARAARAAGCSALLPVAGRCVASHHPSSTRPHRGAARRRTTALHWTTTTAPSSWWRAAAPP
jgi:type VI secretion system protein VasG